jgi:hypothetical protein
MDAELPAAVALEFGDVVSDVVDLARAGGDALPEHPRDYVADEMRDCVPVRPGEVRRRRHAGEVGAAIG